MADKPIMMAKAEHDSLPMFDGTTNDLERLIRAVDTYKTINKLSDDVAATTLMAKLSGDAYAKVFQIASTQFPGAAAPYEDIKAFLRMEYGADKDMMNPVCGGDIQALRIREGEHLGDFHQRVLCTLFDTKVLKNMQTDEDEWTLEDKKHLRKFLHSLATRHFSAGIPDTARALTSQLDFSSPNMELYLKLKNITVHDSSLGAVTKRPANTNKNSGPSARKSGRPRGSNFGFKPKRFYCGKCKQWGVHTDSQCRYRPQDIAALTPMDPTKPPGVICDDLHLNLAVPYNQPATHEKPSAEMNVMGGEKDQFQQGNWY